MAIAIAVALSFCTGRYIFPDSKEVIVKKDTVIHDTTFIDKPVPVVKEILKTEYIPVSDTLCIHDTTFIALPIERKIYQDSSYRAVVTGYHCELESMEVYNSTRIVTNTLIQKKKQRFTFSVSVGVGGFYGLTTKRVDVGPGVMLGASYNF